MKLLISQFLALVLLPSPASAFVPPSRNNAAFVRGSAPALRATIYPSDMMMQDDHSQQNTADRPNSWLYEDEEIEQPAAPLVAAFDQHVDHLLQQLTTTTEYIGSLARLAVAFSPPGQGLHLQDIESVSVIGMDYSHLDIQAVVCADEGCHTIKVPVSFPHECIMTDSDDDDVEECIMHQLETLDHQAGDLLQQLEGREEWEEEHERQWQELVSRPDNYPAWWESPPSTEMFDECKNVRALLNDADFQPEIQGLAYTSLGQLQMRGWTIEEAAVVDISPAGLYIRARARMFSDSIGSAQLSAGSQLIDLPVQFGAVAATVEDLRAFVLGTVASTTEETIYANVEIAEGIEIQEATGEVYEKEDILFVGELAP